MFMGANMKHLLCSNCGKELAPEQTGKHPHRAYDVCPECQEAFQRQLTGRELDKFKKAVEFPVILVNKDLRVLAANESCMRGLCAGAPQPPGLLWGEFMRCQNAQAPERCGGSPSCLQCVIRRAAQAAFKTGKDQKNTMASLTRNEGGQKVRLELTLSTENLGDMVQVTVENFFAVLEPQFRLP